MYSAILLHQGSRGIEYCRQSLVYWSFVCQHWAPPSPSQPSVYVVCSIMCRIVGCSELVVKNGTV